MTKKCLLLSLESLFDVFSGNGVYSNLLLNSLIKLNYDVTVITSMNKNNINKNNINKNNVNKNNINKNNNVDIKNGVKYSVEVDNNKEDITAYAIPLSKWFHLDIHSHWQEYSNFVRETVIENKLYQESFDLIACICWTGIAAFDTVAKYFSNSLKIYFNLKLFSKLAVDDKSKKFYEKYELLGCNITNKCIVLSSFDRELFKKIHNVSNAIVLNCPLRRDINKQAANVKFSLDKRRYILCCCRISKEKHIGHFVRAICKLEDSIHKNNFIPFICGAVVDEDYAEKLKLSLSEHYKISNDIKATESGVCIVTGFLTPHELCNIFLQTILNVHPSTYEPYGMTLVEAASFGCVSLVHQNGIGALDRLSNACVCVDMKSSESIALAIEKLLFDEDNDKNLYQIAQQARQNALTFGEDNYLYELDKIINQ